MTYSDNLERINGDSSYRLPVFRIPRKSISTSNSSSVPANNVRIKQCNYANNFYNISYNNNVIRWLRKPYKVTDEKIDFNELAYYTINNTLPANVEDCYILSQLYIPPNIYGSIRDLIYAINQKLQKSVYELFTLADADPFTLDLASKFWLRGDDSGKKYKAGNEILNVPITPENPTKYVYLGDVTIMVDGESEATTFKVYLDPEKYIQNGGTRLIRVPYYVAILNAAVADLTTFSQYTEKEQAVISIFTTFNCIPVSFDTPIISTTESFINIPYDPQFYYNYTTFELPHPFQAVAGKITAINDNEYIRSYINSTEKCDKFFYNFTSDNDIWTVLGFECCTISYNDVVKNVLVDTIQSNQSYSTIYTIIGQYFSECIYTGEILSSNTFYKQTNEGYYQVDKGQDIRNINENIMNESFYNQHHYGSKYPSLRAPRLLQFRITSNEDVEKIINCLDTNSDVLHNSSIFTYNIIKTDTPIYQGISQVIEINKSIHLTTDKDMFVYITSHSLKYPIIPGEISIDVEYYM